VPESALRIYWHELEKNLWLLCVLCSGLIEESLRLMLSDFAQNKSNPQIASYVSARLGDFQNPKFEKIMVLLGSFDSKWREHFEQADSYEIKDAINSIVSNRHLIAHGGTAGISIVAFGKYYEFVERFIEDLDSLLA
jgi:hypothetical protein